VPIIALNKGWTGCELTRLVAGDKYESTSTGATARERTHYFVDHRLTVWDALTHVYYDYRKEGFSAYGWSDLKYDLSKNVGAFVGRTVTVADMKTQFTDAEREDVKTKIDAAVATAKDQYAADDSKLFTDYMSDALRD
jgi:hypothetical protein